jgi:hypothetical protein
MGRFSEKPMLELDRFSTSFSFFRPLPMAHGVLSETHIRYQLGDMLITKG